MYGFTISHSSTIGNYKNGVNKLYFFERWPFSGSYRSLLGLLSLVGVK